MRKFATVILVFSALLILSSNVLADENFKMPVIGENQKYLAGRAIVQFKQYALPQHYEELTGAKISMGNPSIDLLNDKFNISRVEHAFHYTPITDKNSELNLEGFYLFEFDENIDVMQVVYEYGMNEYVIVAEPDYIYLQDAMPDDQYFSNQYWLDQLNDKDIDAPEAWDYESGKETIIIGVDDSGVFWNHQDLYHSIWQNLGEDFDGDGHTLEGGVFDPGDLNGVDDDGNGLIDDLIGYDWVNVGASSVHAGEDGTIADNNPMDFGGHGTNIAGIVAAPTNNAVGVSGIAGGFRPHFPGIRIMCLRSGYLGPDTLGYVNSYAAAQGMNYAVNKGAKVVNLSFGPGYTPPCDPGYGYNSLMYSATVNALAQDVLVTVAAGNDGVDCPDYLNVINGIVNVAALDENDNRAYYSNFGDWIDISAAGNSMFTTECFFGVPGYDGFDGTSYSSPAVAAVAALVRSHDSSLNRDSVAQILYNTADALSNPDLGAGRVNAYNAIMAMPTAYFTPTAPAAQIPPVTVNFTDASPTAGITDWYWEFGDGGTSDQQNPSHTFTDEGLFDVSLTINSPIGQHTYTYPKMVYGIGDTLWVDKLSALNVNDIVDVYFYLDNLEEVSEIKIPFFYDGTANLVWQGYSVSTTGTRCAYFEKASVVAVGLDRGYIHLRADNNSDFGPEPLPPGSGPICYVTFQVGSSGTSDITLGDSWKEFFIQGKYFKYESEFVDGFVSTGAACQGRCGDANLDTNVNVSDAVYIINYVFTGGFHPLPYTSCGDANSDAKVNVSDAVYLINFVFTGGSAPTDCASGNVAWGGDNCCPFAK